jgi:hypothetical protein
VTLQATDIVFVLSGGSNNPDPLKSLGGDPSSTPILGSLNNLFNDLTTQDAQNGTIDYRCFYIFNNNMIDALTDSKVWVQSEIVGGASVNIGVNLVNEVQLVTIDGPNPGSGNFVLSYNGTNFMVNQSNDVNVWASNFQTAISALPNLTDVTVTGVMQPSAIIFTVTFQGDAGNRSHPLLELVQNNLLPSNTFSFTKQTIGSPINLIAPSIDVPTTPPTGISFTYPISATPLMLGDLRALDGFPVWVKRTLPAGASAIAPDGFTLRLNGQA